MKHGKKQENRGRPENHGIPFEDMFIADYTDLPEMDARNLKLWQQKINHASKRWSKLYAEGKKIFSCRIIEKKFIRVFRIN